VPLVVPTELLPGGSVNEHYLPLDAFVDEVIMLLETQPDATDILVEAVKFVRFAEVEGRYAETIVALNSPTR
jgi:uncharacterized oxidoreductase